MDKELYRKFNEEIHRYRKALLFYANKCDWSRFKDNAGRLFDYCESIEALEIEKKFFRITKGIVAVLVFMVIFILKINPDVYPDLARVNASLSGLPQGA